MVGMAQPPAWACPDDVDLQNAAEYVTDSPKPTDWVGTAIQLSRYALASYWHEFRPDVKRQLMRIKHNP